jgi:hypothetical protein
MTRVVSSLLPFAMDCRSLNLGEGIAVRAANSGSLVGFESFVNTLASLDISPCWWKCSDFRTLCVVDKSFGGWMCSFSILNSQIDFFNNSSHFPSWNFFALLIR